MGVDQMTVPNDKWHVHYHLVPLPSALLEDARRAENGELSILSPIDNDNGQKSSEGPSR